MKNQLLQDLKDTREDLWTALEKLDANTVIYPGWKKREFFTHVAGWEAMVFDVIKRHLSGQDRRDSGYTGIDSANERFVSTRQSMTLDDARLECEINRFAIITLLERIENFEDSIPLPWGNETAIQFVQGAIEHERLHLKDIQNLLVDLPAQ